LAFAKIGRRLGATLSTFGLPRAPACLTTVQ